MLTNQWRAMATTIRYAIAGQAVFGLTRMVSQLKDVQQQMGLISAIGSQPGGLPFTQPQLTNMLQQNMKGALDSITPLNEYNDAVINFLSTVQNVPADQITPMVTTISRAAKLAQISSEDATKAFTTMNVAFGKPTNLENVRRTAQEFFILTQQAPGGRAAGQQVIGQLGQLAAVTKIAGGRPEDIFSLLLSSLRGGIPPSQAGRGLQFLIQTLALPGQQAKPSRDALASVGITQTSQLTLQQRLTRVFKRARQMGVHGNLQKLVNLDDDTLASLDAQPTTTGALGSIGITGPGAAYLGTVFRRIHALRTAVAILGQVDTGQAQKDLALINAAAEGHVSDINDLSKAWDRFAKQAQLQTASVALNNLSLQVAEVLAPVLNLAATGITSGVKRAQRHPDATRDVVLGGVGIAALLGGRRALGGLGIIGKGVGGTQALESLAGKMPTGQIENPFYVRVLGGPLSTGNPLIPNPRQAEKDVEKTAKAGIFTRIGRKALKYGGPIAIAGAATQAIADVSPSQLGYGPMEGGFWNFDLPKSVSGRKGNFSFEQLVAIQHSLGKQVGNLAGITAGRVTGTGKDATLTLNINLKNPDGTVTNRKIHVPANLFTNGNIPSFQGQPSGRR
jgi:hypothetical protein